MFKQIKKRNGQLFPFDANKITTAIEKAGRATGEFGRSTANYLTDQVVSIVSGVAGHFENGIPGVENIQDIVELVLMDSPHKKTAKAYIIYREQHSKIREITIKTKGSVELVDNYLGCLDWKVKENSNMAYSLQGLNNHMASETSKIYWLNKIYPPEVRTAHESGNYHIHDLGQLAVYCVGWSLRDLLLYGFRGAAGKIESKPAKHFRTALGHTVNFFYTLQGEAAGAQAFSNFDTLLAPFVRYDDLSYSEVKQAMQEFIFNINVPTRVGFQTPFTNLTFDLKAPKMLASERIIIGGEYQSATYGEFQREMNLINKAFLEIMMDGDAKNRVFTFPIPTYNIGKDFDWDNGNNDLDSDSDSDFGSGSNSNDNNHNHNLDNLNLDLLWQVTSRYGIPYFANYVNSDLSPDDTRSMCCRLRLDTTILNHRGGGLFAASPLTGSIGVVTINLPAIGYRSANEDQFITELDRLLNLASTSLEIKRKTIERLTDSNLYPYSKYYLRDIKERFGKYWANHFSTIGIIGMNEACLNLFGPHVDIGQKAGREFALRVLSFIREKLQSFQEETGNLYNLEATPGEGTSYRLARLDRERYPNIIFANQDEENQWQSETSGTEVTKKAEPYEPFEPNYTNSSSLPVNYTDDIFELLDHQDDLQASYTGGTVAHIYLGEEAPNPESLKNFIRKVCEHYRLPYFTITPTFSVCPQHGYISGQHEICSRSGCGAKTEVYSRVVGYLRPVDQWNLGKREEFCQRKTFDSGIANNNR